MTDPFSCDLTQIPPEHLAVLRRWVEDRFVNAVTPLSIRLQREPHGNFLCDLTLREARKTVDHVMEHVNEIRALSDATGRDPGAAGTIVFPPRVG